MKLENFKTRLLNLQTRHPWALLITAALITAVAAWLASGLRFDSSYEALLPEGSPEILNADTVRERTGGVRELIVAIQGDDEQARIDFARQLVPELQKIPEIRAVDLEFPIDFFTDRGLWLMAPDTLDRLIPAVRNAIQIAQAQANPMALHLDPEAEKEELTAAWQAVNDIVEEQKGALPFDTIAHSKDGTTTFLMLIPTIKLSDVGAVEALHHRIDDIIQQRDPASLGLAIRYAGQMEMLREQHQYMTRDLTLASILTFIFGIAIVAIFTGRLLSPFIILTGLGSGILWTFAIARLTIGHINIITGFMVSVLIGLGIDFSIHMFLRFQQEMQRPGTSTEALYRAIRGTFNSALTASLTTAGVFITFVIADFRGFSEFGLLAAIGVMLTYVSTFTIVPAILYLVFRNRTLPKPLISLQATDIKWLERPFFRRFVLIAFSALACFGIFNAGNIKFRNNFRALRGEIPAVVYNDWVAENIGTGFNPAVFIAENIADAEKIKDILTAHIDAQTADSDNPTNIRKVISPSVLIPRDTDEIRPRIEELKDLLWSPKFDRAAEKDTDEGEKLRQARKMVNADPWQFDEIPEVFRRRFVTVDETDPGYIVYAWPQQQNDADYLAVAWEKELNGLSEQMTQQSIPHMMGDETLILAWVHKLVKADGPPLMVLAFVVVTLFLVLDFRRPRKVLLLLVPLTMGMGVTVGLMHLLGMEINMFNLIVVPSLLGIGIDNAVHIFHRYEQEFPDNIWNTVRTTGVAAFLASSTTTVGFGSALVSHTLGLRTMGSLAVVGIASMFVAAAFFFPALCATLTRKKRR